MNDLSKKGTRASTPRHHAFVRPGTIVFVEVQDFSHGFLVEFLSVGRQMKVEVAAKQLVRAFAAEHHFDAHGADATGHEIHGVDARWW